MGKIVCNGVSINFQQIGKGKDVVLIHGLAANHAFWHINVLFSLVRNYRVTVFDLRGHGYSSMPKSGYTSKDMAEDLHELFNRLGITNAHIVGHSFGGVVALHFASMFPDRVNKLIIADSRIRAFQSTNRPCDWSNWNKAKEKLDNIGINMPEEETEAGFWLLEQLALPELRQAREILKDSPIAIPYSEWGGGKRSAEKWLNLLRTTSAKKEIMDIAGLSQNALSNVQHPVLAIYGENSPTLPSLSGLKELWDNCQSAVVSGAGHFFPLTRPKLFVEIVNQFLSETDQQKTELIYWDEEVKQDRKNEIKSKKIA
jgi:pimeloyl-ACP methyl ester carboxylesterase